MQSVVKQTLIFMEIKQHTFRVISESSIFMHTIKQDTLHLVVIMSDLFFGSPKSLQMVTAAMILKDTYSLEGKL